MSDPLPSDKQREALCDMAAAAFVEIRLLGWDGQAQQAADLADAFHNVTREIFGWGSWSWSIFRGTLQSYQDKYHSSAYLGKRDYVSMLDDIQSVA